METTSLSGKTCPVPIFAANTKTIRVLFFVFCATAVAACGDGKKDPAAAKNQTQKTEQLSRNEQLIVALDTLSKKRIDLVAALKKTADTRKVLEAEKAKLDNAFEKLSAEMDVLREAYKKTTAWPFPFKGVEYTEEGFKRHIVETNKSKNQAAAHREHKAKEIKKHNEDIQEIHLALKTLDRHEEEIRFAIKKDSGKEEGKSIAQTLKNINTDYGRVLEHASSQSVVDSVPTGVSTGTVSDKEFEEAMKN
ncbi:MAG: hypothetical protein LBS59_00860 [Puniceicoccales bacterium]|jgi:chromosome segregation ATPase|nr:hypothetical protein [Puniceicoccales bacterium]